MAQAEMLILSYLGEPFSVALEERPGGHGLQPLSAGGEGEATEGDEQESVDNQHDRHAELPELTSLGCSATCKTDDKAEHDHPE